MSNIHKYACCEGGTYHEDTYSDLDQGQGLLEVGSWVSVDMDLVPVSAKAVYRIIKSNFRNAPRKENTRRKRQLSVQLDRKFQNIILEKSTFLSIFRCKWYSIDIQD